MIKTDLKQLPTDSEDTENGLEDSEDKFHAIINNAKDSVILVDSDGRIVFWNPAAEEVFGYQNVELFGQTLHKLLGSESFHQNNQQGLAFTETEDANLGKTLELEVVKNDGAEIMVEFSFSPLAINGKSYFVGIGRDTTERKNAEKELTAISSELYKTAEQLNVANEKLGAVGKLTRHDVRNKLSVVTGNIYLAKRALPPDSKTANYLKTVESAVDQIVQILDFARIYERLGIEELTYIDVGQSFERAASLLTDLTGIELVNNCVELKVVADSLVTTLFYNLMDNSLRHGETVSKIRIYNKKTNDGLLLIYEDNGVGVPDHEKEKIFGEGYGKNTGLGLHIINLMCRIYGWTIQETGTPGKGAQFTITVPDDSYLLQ